MDNRLHQSALRFIECLDLCFGDGDSSHTESLPFQYVADAITGSRSGNEAEGCNIENLRQASRSFRSDLATSIAFDICDLKSMRLELRD